MKVHVASLGYFGTRERDWIVGHVTRSPQSPITLVEHPSEADAILLTDAHITVSHAGTQLPILKVLSKWLVWRYRTRCFIYAETDVPRPWFPGLYHHLEWFRGVEDFAVNVAPLHLYEARPHLFVNDEPAPDTRDLLYSYMGRTSHPVRDALLRASPERADIVVRDTTALYQHFQEQRDVGMQQEYAAVMRRSRWALCPRGWSASSLRLYDAMRMGVAPVVVCDNWYRPPGPDWDQCSLWVPESELARLPQILEAQGDRWRVMGAAARAAWHDWFGPDRWIVTAGAALTRLVERRARASQLKAIGAQAVEWVHHKYGWTSRGIDQARAPGHSAIAQAGRSTPPART